MCDFERVTPRSRGKPKRFLWPNRAGPPCRARAPARDAPPGQTVGADVLIGPGKGRALALREHIPRLNSPPNSAETVPRAGLLSMGHPPWWEPEEHIPRLNGPPGKEAAPSSA